MERRPRPPGALYERAVELHRSAAPDPALDQCPRFDRTAMVRRSKSASLPRRDGALWRLSYALAGDGGLTVPLPAFVLFARTMRCPGVTLRADLISPFHEIAGDGKHRGALLRITHLLCGFQTDQRFLLIGFPIRHRSPHEIKRKFRPQAPSSLDPGRLTTTGRMMTAGATCGPHVRGSTARKRPTLALVSGSRRGFR